MNKNRIRGKDIFSLSDQPQEFFKVLRDANRLFFASFTTAFPLALLGNVFMLALFALFAVPALLSASSNEGTWNNTLWLLPMCATLVFYPAAMSSVLISVHGIADAQPVKLSQALKGGFRRIFPCIIGAAIFLVSVSIGSVLFLVPGIVLFFSLSFWWAEVVLDEQDALIAIRSSRRLVSGNWWRSAIVLFTIIGLFMAFSEIPMRTVNLFPASYAQNWPALTFGFILAMLGIVATPIMASAIMVTQYNDLKRRNPMANAGTLGQHEAS